MKYKVGDKVRVKSLEWYNENKDEYGTVHVPFSFIKEMKCYCGRKFTIQEVLDYDDGYKLSNTDNQYNFSDEMLEPIEYTNDTNTALEIPAGYEFDRIESGKIILKKQEVTTYDTIINIFGYEICNKFKSAKEAKSAIAMAKISQLMPYYGGTITNEEWYNEDMPKYCIERRFDIIRKITLYGTYTFLAFRTKEQRERFMSYPDNMQLVKDYLMID